MKDYLDFFGEPFKLNYKGKYSFKTSLSTYVLILFLILIILYSFINLYQMLCHKGLNIKYFQKLILIRNLKYNFNL